MSHELDASYHKTLLNDNSTAAERNLAAMSIIKDNDIPLETQQLLKSFKLMRVECTSDAAIIRFLLILEYCLKYNKNMYIAFILNYRMYRTADEILCVLSYGTISPNGKWYYFLIGSSSSFQPNNALCYYRSMLDHYYFSIDKLDIPKDIKKSLQEYSDSLYGTLVKRAIK
jgi:hypothetical protein